VVVLAVDELRAFGLSAYEAQAYAALLALGPSDAATLGLRAGIPFGRVYDVLHALVGRNLAQVREGRPKLFVPVAPREALEALMHARRNELTEQAERLQRLAPALEEQLARLGQAGHLRGAPYHVSIGRRDARLALAQVVEDAKETIVASLEFERYDPADHAVFEAIRKAAERGLRIRALMRPQDLRTILASEFVGPISQLILPFLGENFDVRINEKAGVPFSVTDSDRVTLGVRDPVHPAQHFAVVVVRDAKVAADLTGKFETLWQESQELWDVLDLEGGEGGDALA
jgi:HTH-type transcriptional regulator, sugar sensing transcriptional regulator